MRSPSRYTSAASTSPPTKSATTSVVMSHLRKSEHGETVTPDDIGVRGWLRLTGRVAGVSRGQFANVTPTLRLGGTRLRGFWTGSVGKGPHGDAPEGRGPLVV